MAFAPRLELRQSQSLVMTPQLQQAIKLLQLNNLELTAYVEAELAENPLLERDERRPDDGAGRVEPTDTRPGADQGVLDGLAPRREAPVDVEHDNNHDEGSPGEAAPSPYAAPGASGRGGDGELPSLEETLAEGDTLRRHLERQIGLEFADPGQRLIALALLDGLDAAGYLRAEADQLAAQLGADPAQVAAVLARLKRLDPPGVFAADLAECLALQLAEKNRLDPAMEALLANLDLLARRDLSALRDICGVDEDDLAGMIAEIRRLDPKPGSDFAAAPAQTLIPDVLMRPAPDGGWLVELNPDTLPRVLVNNRYLARVSGSLKREDKAFLADRLATAQWLTRALDQRARTILKVATELVRRQDGFFAHGVSHLKPLTLRDIATAVELHESTVSRVTSNKYLMTPRGIFELKYFFTQAIAATNGAEAHSAEAVRHRIKGLIDAEPADAVLSDDALVALLKAEGIDIARRTVAKYREGLGLPSSVQRRREKKQRAASA